MDELIAFVMARLDEDEAMARRNIGSAPGTANGLGDTEEFGPSWPDYQTYDDDEITAAYKYLDRFRPLRMLREVAAKRALLAMGDDGEGYAYSVAVDRVLVQLAAVYSDHPDYRAEWAPADR